MPLPLVLIGIAVASAVAGGYGVKKSVDAYKDNKKADELSEKATDTYNNAERVLMRARESTLSSLQDLGRLKLEVWEQEMQRFVSLYGKLHPIELINRMDTEAGRAPLTKVDLGEMAKLSGFATQALAGGALAIGAGALAGVAAYGGAVMFAAASTGTAISALSGAAATNATLAWFGGGALAAGGLGMAGGMAVLGGIVAGPVLAVGGAVFAAMAREKLANARSHLAEARRASHEMRMAASVLEGIERVAVQFRDKVRAVRVRFNKVLEAFDAQIASKGADYRMYDRPQRELVHVASQFAQVMKALLETPFLTPEGALRADFEPALTSAAALLSSPQAARTLAKICPQQAGQQAAEDTSAGTAASDGRCRTATTVNVHRRWGPNGI